MVLPKDSLIKIQVLNELHKNFKFREVCGCLMFPEEAEKMSETFTNFCRHKVSECVVKMVSEKDHLHYKPRTCKVFHTLIKLIGFIAGNTILIVFAL